MDAMPRVSVVIATCNRAEFLPATLDSVLEQEFRDFELIVVDDGSTDDTEAVLRRYGDRIRVISQPNQGPSAARNTGAAVARAPWIAFQDSDDLCAPQHLATLYGQVLRQPDCGMVFANGAYLKGPEHSRETIIPAFKSRRMAREGLRWRDLFEKSIVRLQAALLSKAAYDAIGGHDPALRISMDLDLAFRIFARYPIAYLDAVVFYYRKHSGNSVLNHELRLAENIRVIERLLREFPQAGRELGARRVARRLAYRHYKLAQVHWRAGRREEARSALKEAVALMPLHPKYRLWQLRWA
jgi:glycosyltransferase involved in cell wall biosynthesis